MILKILSVKEPTLRQKSKKVKKIDKKIKKLIVDMKHTLTAQKDPEGIGLAAPQVGKNLRIFLMKPNNKTEVIINPEILEKTEKLVVNKISSGKIDGNKKNTKQKGKIMEGCLSLPHFYGPLARAEKIKIKFMDETGNEKEETYEGINAQIVQHEIDHLNGILFIDRLLEQKGKLFEYSGDEWEEVKLI